jgi:excisionase family DNA binding protein
MTTMGNNELTDVEAWLDTLEPEQTTAEDAQDLRDVAELTDSMTQLDARLTEAVRRARMNGKSWTKIAIALGVSHQAARQRFADRADEPADPDDGGKDWLSATEAAALFHVDPKTIRRWHGAGKLPGAKPSGKGLRVPRTTVDRLLRAGPSGYADCQETASLTQRVRRSVPSRPCERGSTGTP